MLLTGNREAAQELAGRAKEHAQLAKEARQKANQAAFDSCLRGTFWLCKVYSIGWITCCIYQAKLQLLARVHYFFTSSFLLSQVDLHGLHVEEALQVLEQHLVSLGGLGCPGGILLQVGCSCNCSP